MTQITLKGKNAFVTGATRGIGREIALTLADAGANISLGATNEELLHKVAKEIDVKNVKTAIHKIDVSDYTSVEKAVDATYEKFGSIDILVSNAGITRDNIILRLKDEDWDRVLDVNLKGTFNCIKAVTKYMMKQRSGKIINISSVSGIIGNAGQANYASSKAAIIALTKTAAREFASRNININTVAPGFITTDMTMAMDEKTRNSVVENIPLKRFGEPKDIANTVLFLASDLANYITGQTIIVDGGMAM